MRILTPVLLAGISLAGLVLASVDDQPFELAPGEIHHHLDSNITPPRDFLGFEIGSRLINHRETESYFRYLSRVSDRARFLEYGLSEEGNKLFALVVSEPDHIRNLSQIGENLNQISVTGPGSRLIEETPAVAWMGYGIHGDEVAPTDAAVMVAYRLVADDNKVFSGIRTNLITYIDPMFNPDGRSRAMAHVSKFNRGIVPTDPQDMAHNQLWPDGRGNHYLADLNRDALFQIQQQSRSRVAAIRQANPQLYVSSHESSWRDTYLFAVPAEPLNPYLPQQVHQSWAEFSVDHSAAFDRRGISYYTRAWNEVFYPGFYDIWPAYFGAVPILYEQPTTSGLSVDLPNGKVRHFHKAVSNHYRSSIANLLTAATRKKTLLQRWSEVRSKVGKDFITSWVVLPNNQYKWRETLRILRSLGIEVQILEEPLKDVSLHTFWQASTADTELPVGTLKVDVDQPLRRLVHNLLDYHVPMSTEFLSTEKRNLDLGKATQLYDVTAWSLPLAFNADIFWSKNRIGGKWRRVDADTTLSRTPTPQQPKYGYIYTDPSLHTTLRLLRKGIKIRIGNEAFSMAGNQYPAGTLLIRNEDQSSDFTAALNDELGTGAIRVVAAPSARITEGGPDLGGDSFPLLTPPRVAVLGGAPVKETSFGAIWHLFDGTIGIPVTLLNLADLDEFDMFKYSVIVLPEVNAEMVPVLTETKKDALLRWVDAGGVLITLGRSSLLAAKLGISSVEPGKSAIASQPPLMVGRSPGKVIADDFKPFVNNENQDIDPLPPVLGAVARQFAGGKFKAFDFVGNVHTFEKWVDETTLPKADLLSLALGARDYLPRGAYLRVDLRSGHWLGYAVGERVPVLFRERDTLIPTPGIELVGRFAPPESLMMSGLLWPEATGYIAGSAYLTAERRGRGYVILFANDPLFRGYSLGTERLFLNAVTLSGAFK